MLCVNYADFFMKNAIMLSVVQQTESRGENNNKILNKQVIYVDDQRSSCLLCLSATTQ
jgi:hypothetical protein